MIKKLILFAFVLLVLLSIKTKAQNKLTLNTNIDTSAADIKAAIEIWSNYISSPRKDRARYWNSAEKQKYTNYNLLNNQSLFDNIYDDIILLGVKHTKNGFIQLKTSFAFVGTDNKKTLFAIVNVLAKKEGDHFVLYNILPQNTASWNTKKVGFITYHYSKDHSFNIKKANQAVGFLNSFVKNFGISLKPVDYYFAKDCETRLKLLGFDYLVGSFVDNPICGEFDLANNIIYVGGGDEFYPHELMRFVNKQIGASNGFWNSGITTLWGGSLGYSLSEQIKKLDSYLKQHSEIDLNDLGNFSYVDQYTVPEFVISGLLSDLILEKQGKNKLLELLRSKEEDTKSQIYSILNASEKNLNEKLRALIDEYASGRKRIKFADTNLLANTN